MRRPDWPGLLGASVLAAGIIAIYCRTFAVPFLLGRSLRRGAGRVVPLRLRPFAAIPALPCPVQPVGEPVIVAPTMAEASPPDEGEEGDEIELPELPELYLAETPGEDDGAQDLVLVVLATLYSVARLRIPVPRQRPSWDSTQSALDRIYDTLITRRCVEHGLEPGSRLFGDVKRAAEIGVTTSARNAALWN